MDYKRIQSCNDLAAILDVPLKTLCFWFYGLPPGHLYSEFRITKRSKNSTRLIASPNPTVKKIQRRLLDIFSEAYEPRECVHGFVSGKSIVSNAVVHIDKNWILKTDIKDFFPSISFYRVRGIFRSPPFSYSASVANLLAQMCCYRNQLPQGAPTSPLLSNIVCRRLDGQLSHLVRLYECDYSRYCDDITISGNLPRIPNRLFKQKSDKTFCAGDSLREIIESNGFEINAHKTKAFHRSKRQMVTGLVVNQKVSIKKEYRRNIRKALFIWDKHGEAAFYRFMQVWDSKNRPPGKEKPSWESVLRGKINFVGMVLGWDSGYYKQFTEKLAKIKS